ncbi:hypothetical protein S7711_01127 [Stachybotrys chartarum IBT 7711]|uniref:Uncharacterized protein n=1 Tax=Stachybotrys chartarum (strain CBS 109288 / IBT 7711) TaxID=1280523 RepID=A0A084ASS0_STACB|nr:hypothetical protein S7711_01127 [Stachybotrys chartarum IBT 7711]KFA48935.1 hypothetical protein S40293_02562 [Stachybotrys chartarum IBT 40293]
MADHTNSTDLNHIDLLAQLCGLFQGITALLKLGGCQTAVLSAMRTAKMPHHSRAVAIREVSWAEADKSIDQLVGAINALDEADDGSRKRKHVLGKGASKLHALVQGVARGENNWEAVCMWLGRVDAEFVDMIRNRDPLALVLLTHWIVTRNGLNVWWASQWTRLAITAITPVLDGQYVHLLDWCMQEAGAAPSTRVEDIKEDEVL